MKVFKTRLWEKLKLYRLGYLLVTLKVRHVHGERCISFAKDELIVVCLTKNAESYIPSFINHYIGLGVKHIIILDNGSADDTIKIASMYAGVSVFSCSLPYKKYSLLMRQYLFWRFGKMNHWILCVDIDELFDYPCSDRLHLNELLNYLKARKFTTMVAYMLDMFSEQPVSSLKPGVDDLKNEYPYFDISSISKTDYLTYYPYRGYSNQSKRKIKLNNILPNSEIKHYIGGIRAKIFNLPGVFLIKHPLIFMDGKTELVHEHFVDHASVADTVAVLYHYKFISGISARIDNALKERQYSHDSVEYQKYYQVMKKTPDICLKTDSAMKLESVNDLVDLNFLQVSKDYLEWTGTHNKYSSGS